MPGYRATPAGTWAKLPLVHPINFSAMPRLDFTLTGDYIELHQLLKLSGIATSGGEGKALVAQGLVRVDGAPEERKTAKIRAGQTVRIGDTTIAVLAG
jgi:ribosome-associated protein